MSDLISRQAAIDLVESFYKIDKSVLKIMVFKLKQLPYAQPTTLTEDDKETIRIHLSAFKERLCNQHRWNEAKEYEELISRLLSTPSVQPEGIRCKDCKHWMMGKTTKNYPNPYICELHSFMHGFERSALPEDYCSWAELRGDSDEND